MPKKRTMDIFLEVLEERQAVDVRVIDLSGQHILFDFMVIAGGISSRHALALCDYLEEVAKLHGIKPLGIEGKREGRWVLLDFGDIIVHIMVPEAREFYDLEGLWQQGGNMLAIEQISQLGHSKSNSSQYNLISYG